MKKYVMPAKAGIQLNVQKNLDASLRWHDIFFQEEGPYWRGTGPVGFGSLRPL
jgi:hypothetical protein